MPNTPCARSVSPARRIRLITGEWEAEAALRSLLHRFVQDKRQQQEGKNRPQRTHDKAGSLGGVTNSTTGDAATTIPLPRAGVQGGRVDGTPSTVGFNGSSSFLSGGGEGADEDDIGEF